MPPGWLLPPGGLCVNDRFKIISRSASTADVTASGLHFDTVLQFDVVCAGGARQDTVSYLFSTRKFRYLVTGSGDDLVTITKVCSFQSAYPVF